LPVDFNSNLNNRNSTPLWVTESLSRPSPRGLSIPPLLLLQ
jgi:hypothetical protein